MQISSIGSKVNFGRFEKRTAEKLLNKAKNDELAETAVKEMIIKAGQNHDYHIKEEDGSYRIYSEHKTLGGLGKFNNTTIKDPLTAIAVADFCANEHYKYISDIWNSENGYKESNIIDLITTQE